jgi:hypothetical protein
MTRPLVMFVAALCALGSVTAGDATTTHPRLRLLDTASVSFHGIGFQSRERVRVAAYIRERTVKRVVVGPRGGFVVRFADLQADRCAAFSAVAVGNQGSRATFKRPLPECPPA